MTISVVIPLYNKQATVLRALQSVLAQSHLPQEIIVVNDGSTDGSEQLVTALQHPLIGLVHQANAGVSAARNQGIALAQHDWVAFLDADDTWDANYLASILQLHQHYPTAHVLATNYRYLMPNGQTKATVLKHIPWQNQAHGLLHNYFEVAAASSPPLWSSAVVVHKTALNHIGGFPLGIKLGEDLLTWARLAEKFEIAYHKNPLSTFFKENINGEIGRIPGKIDLVGIYLIEIRNRNKSLIGINKYISHWKLMRISINLRIPNSLRSFKDVFLAIKFYPLNKKCYIFFVMTFFPFPIRKKIFKIWSTQN